jgi:hypothetical protein
MDTFTVIQPYGDWVNINGQIEINNWNNKQINPNELSLNELTAPNWINIPDLEAPMVDGQFASVRLLRPIQINVGPLVFHHPINHRVSLFMSEIRRVAHLADDPLLGPIPNIVGGRRLKRKDTKKSKKHIRRRKSKRRANRSNRH